VNSASVSDEFRNAFGRNYREVGLMQLADHPLEKRMQLLIACDPFNLWRIDIAYSIPIDASEGGIVILVFYGLPHDAKRLFPSFLRQALLGGHVARRTISRLSRVVPVGRLKLIRKDLRIGREKKKYHEELRKEWLNFH